MIGRRKRWKTLLFLTCIACLFFSYTKIFAFSSKDLHLPIITVQDNLVKNLIYDYCTGVLTSPAFIENKFLYNAQQSAFVHLLCKNMDLPSSYFTYFSKEGDYFKLTSFQNIWFQDITVDQIDLCTPNSFSNDCDLATNIPKLFNAIMNDYVNMKQPNLYGMNTNIVGDGESQINEFSSGYFDGIQVCGSTLRSYPKTCSMMKWYMKNVRNILSDVRILNASGILALTKTNVSCATVTITGDVFACWLYNDPTSSLASFVNLAYNELFYYRLFMWYYLVLLQRYPSLLEQNTYMTDYASILKTFSTQYMWSKDALSLSLRMMRDTYMAFPFHVGFSMYQEDLDGFAKTLKNVMPSIYTLWLYKFKNVQAP